MLDANFARATLNFGGTFGQLLGVNIFFQFEWNMAGCGTIKTYSPAYKESLAEHTHTCLLLDSELDFVSVNVVYIEISGMRNFKVK